MNKLKQSLTCPNCSKIFKDPVELPCDDFICREHLNDKDVIKENKIKCFKCKQEFEVKGNDFKSNKFVQIQINDQMFLNDKEISLKQQIEESFRVFYQMYDTFSLSKTKLDLDCHEHFQGIRFQLDMHREKLKEKIDDIYMEMIDKTKKYETNYLKSLNEKLVASLKQFEIHSIGEDLIEVAETFRDPQLLIKTIEEMNLKQQEAIATIQSNLNIMNQVKDDLKASNQFEPNLNFNKDFFGQLNLGEHSSFNQFFNSKILTGQQPKDLIELCEFNLNNRFKFLYRASEHGFHANEFHSKCDGHTDTLTILKANGFIFGGFTSVTWESSDKYKSDPNAFLFSLTNKDKKPCKMEINPNKQQYAILCSFCFGPIFGGQDIQICSNSNTNISSYSILGSVFKHPQYVAGTNEANYFLAGSQYFQLSEIEVYQKE